jgi:endonuclease/exonuclease/phosphatase family metal-dependent hydrolase
MTNSISFRFLLAPKRSALATILVLTAFVFGCSATARADDPSVTVVGARADDRDGGVVRVMTQNLFQGTNFSEILSATTPPAFLMAVTTTRQNILATKPAERAAAVAREIARERPDLVALQEAAILRSGFVPLTVPATPVPTVEVDQLALVLAELERLGHPYHVVAILPNLDAQAPSSTGASVRLTARMAIMARSDLGPNDILSNIQEQEYLNFTRAPTPVGVSIADPRGWASVDVKVNGREFRFITTHLDQNQSINRAQAAEALQSAVDSTTLPVVFVGDFNVVANIPSDSRFANYQALLNAGLVDAWQQSGGPDPGLNCCQSPALTNVTTNFTFRVDLVLLRGAIDIRNIHLVGNNISDRIDGVWPSDHAGIVATLRIRKDHN